MSRILVTGGAGYIGSVLVQSLLEGGNEIVCLDRFFFGQLALSRLTTNSNLKLIKDDIRWFDPQVLKNVDTVMDLAAISNDPSGELDPAKTYDINYLGRSRVARLSKQYGVRRYILASSCSLYGHQEGMAHEESNLNPLTSYATANMKAEEDILPLSTPEFSVTVLRFATVYGYSERMRFDLAINSMVLNLFKGHAVPVMRDGKQWRPFIHIKDAAKAYDVVMNQPDNKVNGKIFNVGSNDQNYQILPLSEKIANSLGVDYQINWYGSSDSRSYKISFDRIKTELGFETKYTPEEASREIYEALKTGKLEGTIKTKTLDWYKYLIECQRIINEVSLKETVL